MRLTCILIGQDNLLIQCAHYLMERHHDIKWVVSPMESIQAWCGKNNIPCVDSLHKLPENRENLVDYLFSIVNGVILKKSDLNMARYGVINYHDSLLPHYAGVHATSWAIINDEKIHGITWHVVTEGIDEGDIVYQKSFPIQENETALTLNVSCFNEAADGFSEIIQKIESSSLTRKKQNRDKRSYYGLTHPIPDLGFINWKTSTAESIDLLCRALDFGNYKNSLGTVKLLLKDNYLIVLEVEKSNQTSTLNQGGRVLSIGKNGLTISTTSGPILIKKLMTLQGSIVTPKKLLDDYKLAVDDQLPALDDELLQKRLTLYSQALKHETFWMNQLSRIVDHEVFSQRIFQENTIPIHLTPVALGSELSNADPHSHFYLLATVFLYLYRLNNYENSTLFFIYNSFPQNQSPLNKLWSTLLPVTTDLQSHLSCKQVLEETSRMFDCILKNGSYLSDMYVRQPSLVSNVMKCIITVECSNTKMNMPEHSLIHFHVNQNTNELQIAHRINTQFQGGIIMPLVENIAAHLNNIFHYMLYQPETPIHKLVFLTEQEQKKLFEWSVGEYIPLPSNTITELFEYSVHRTPDHPAIYADNQRITYYELWKKAEKVTDFINRFNLPPEHLIGICVESGIEMIAIVLGVIKSGCICIPLPLHQLHFETNSIITQYPVCPIIISDSLVQTFTHHNPSLQLHTLQEIYLAQNVCKPLANRSLPHYDVIHFFDVQTRRSKKITQKNLINYGFWFNDSIHFKKESILDLSSQLSINVFLFSVFGPLFAGGTLSIKTMHPETSMKEYLKYVQNQKISHLSLALHDWKKLVLKLSEIESLTKLNLLFCTERDSVTNIAEMQSICTRHRYIIMPEVEFE